MGRHNADSDARGGTRGPARSRRSRWPLGDRSGQVLALFAIAAIPLMAMLALGIDVGLLFTARDEAQRAAESGALAGAAVFKGCKLLECASFSDAAHDQAIDYATSNRIRDLPITEAEVQVQVMPDERKVRVFVDREGVPTFFAHLLGVPVAPIGAVAAAKVSSGGTSQCVLPFFGPDLWHEASDDNQIPESDDPDWVFGDDEGDWYQPRQPNGDGTGYGSDHRDPVVEDPYVGDVGREIVISSTSPGQSEGALGTMIGPGNFQLWRMPVPDEDGVCDPDNPVYSSGANDVRNIISGEDCGCPLNLVEEYEYDTEPGGKWGGVKQGMDTRISMDPDAHWDDDAGVISDLGDDSPRVVKIALADPTLAFDLNGSHPILFENFAEIFLVGYCDSNKVGQDAGALDCDEEFGKHTVIARFMGFVDGGFGPETGHLIEYLRIVE